MRQSKLPHIQDVSSGDLHDSTQVRDPADVLVSMADRTSVLQVVKWMIKHIVGTTLKPIELAINPKYLPSRDVSLIVPTIDFDSDLIVSLRSWLSNEPKEIIIVTSARQLAALTELIHTELLAEERRTVQILSYPRANKRGQLVTGIQKATGSIIFFADDDVFWPPTVVAYMLAGFECATGVGAVGGFHRARRQDTPAAADLFNGWQALAARRLSIRKLDIAVSVHLDGSVPCVSGRTAAYRSEIVRDSEFQKHFTNEYWLGLYRLNSGDDQFMTRWVIDQGWPIRIQSAPEAEIETTVLRNAVYLRQWLRWRRHALRSYSKRLLFSRRVYRCALRLQVLHGKASY
jgi:cellulose synthase/poly-beta-1,6-N-acetylglucosamine synthase-like glycosyltransferase